MRLSCTHRAPRRLTAAIAITGALLAILAGGGAARAATLPTLTITASGSSITVSGSPHAGAVNVVSSVSGGKEAAIVLFQLKPGVSAAELEAFLRTKASGDPNSVGKYGAIVLDVEPQPGSSNETQTTLGSGEYLALVIAGEGPPKAHVAFAVASSTTPVALPAPQATVRSIEFGFKGPSTLRDGELVRFENEGFLVHMDVAFPVKSRAAAIHAANLLLKGKEKQAQKLIAGAPVTFAGPVSSGAFQQELITAKPGWYVQACFMQTQDGRDHTQLGMERVIKITK